MLTNEEVIYNSLYSVNKILAINAGQVKLICEGLNYCKSATSKKDGQKYTFEYLKQNWFLLHIQFFRLVFNII